MVFIRRTIPQLNAHRRAHVDRLAMGFFCKSIAMTFCKVEQLKGLDRSVKSLLEENDVEKMDGEEEVNL